MPVASAKDQHCSSTMRRLLDVALCPPVENQAHCRFARLSHTFEKDDPKRGISHLPDPAIAPRVGRFGFGKADRVLLCNPVLVEAEDLLAKASSAASVVLRSIRSPFTLSIRFGSEPQRPVPCLMVKVREASNQSL